MKKKLVFITLSCVLLFIVAVLSTNAQAPTEAKIIFMTDRDGNWEIYSMNKDGRNLKNLTKNRGDDFAPKWSPDGTTIAFCSGRDRQGWEADVYLMDPDGRNQRSLGNTAEAEQDLGWSPDGKQIVMEVNLGSRQIVIMDADGKNRVQLTRPADGANQQPSWCPDGRIAFTSDRDGTPTNTGRRCHNAPKIRIRLPKIIHEKHTILKFICLESLSAFKCTKPVF